MDKKKKIIMYIVIILAILLVIVGISFAVFNYSQLGEENSISTGEIHFNYVESQDEINLKIDEPTSDNNAKTSNDYFDLTLKSSATGIVNVGYYIYLNIISNGANIPDANMKVYLTQVNVVNAVETETEVLPVTTLSNLNKINLNTLTLDNTTGNYDLYNNYFSFNNNATEQIRVYRFRIWPDETYMNTMSLVETNDGLGNHQVSQTSATYKVKINVKAVDGIPNSFND